MPDVLDVPEPPSPAPPVLLDDEELAPLCSTQVVRNYGTVTVPKIYQNLSAGMPCDGDIIEEYTVCASDSLAKIAINLDTTVARLRRINNLSSNSVFSGQRLLYPRARHPPVTPVCSTAVEGCSSPSEKSKAGRIVERITRDGNRVQVWQAAPVQDATQWKPDPGRSPIYRVPTIDLV